MAKLAYLGLGTMGAPMARHLAAAGHDLTVYNRSSPKAEAWVAANGGRMAASAAEAAEGADAVFSSVGTDDDLADVTLGARGAFRTMKPGSLFVDHSTVSARIARQLGVEGKDRGLRVLDAPVTGAQVGAEAGRLSLMCGGPRVAFDIAEPLMQAYALRIVHIGGSGAGQTAKMVNQIALAATAQGIAEALRFAQNAGLDLDRTFEVIQGGAAGSWQLSNRWASMAEDRFDFGFAVDWMRKDLGLAIDEARANGAALPMTALIDQFFADVQAMHGGRQDTSALVRRLPKR
jgi:3-hydroxyisobutyrate dehydrogenase